jgi:hypothetical protein
MGAHPIGVGRQWPCVGSPGDQMYSCGAEGSISLLGAVEGSRVGEGLSDEPVMIHLTVCSAHLREVRAWLREISPLPVQTWKTATLMEHWGQVTESMEDTPIYRLQRAG